MLIVKNTLVSEDIRDVRFSCDFTHCKGMCCVEGDGGAPLLEGEIDIIEKFLPQIKPFIPETHLKVIENEGFFYKDDEEYCTNLVSARQCVFVYFDGETAKCAIEKAYDLREIVFQKPVSCHLYPIRVTDYGDFSAVNFHYWHEVCGSSLNESGLPLYELLKTPLVRRFGQDWYVELLKECTK